MSIKTFIKDPDAVKDYELDWGTNYLTADEVIVESTWLLPAGITVDPDHPDLTMHTDRTATIWLAGGTCGQIYLVTSRIWTSQGRDEDGTLRFIIRNK